MFIFFYSTLSFSNENLLETSSFNNEKREIEHLEFSINSSAFFDSFKGIFQTQVQSREILRQKLGVKRVIAFTLFPV